MADHVSTEITFGGALPRAFYPQLLEIIADEGLTTEWDGPPFDETEMPSNGPLTLMAHGVAWGTFSDLEAFCRTHGLPYVRTFDPYVGGWDSGKVIFDGSGEPRSYTLSQDGDLLLSRSTFLTFGSLEEIAAFYGEGTIALPPLTIVEDGDA